MNTAFARRCVFALLVLSILAFAGPAGATEYRASDYPGSGAVDASVQVAQVVPDADLQTQAARSNLSDGDLLFDAVFQNGNLEIATKLVADDAIIHTDRGDFSGPEGLLAYLDVLHPADVDGALTRTNVTAVNNLVFIDWILEGGSGPHEGLTLAIIENGQFTTIWMLDASAVAQPTVPEFGVVERATDTEVVSSTDLTMMDCLVSCIP